MTENPNIIHSFRYVIVPIVVITGDPVLGKDLPGSDIFWAVVHKIQDTITAVTGRRARGCCCCL